MADTYKSIRDSLTPGQKAYENRRKEKQLRLASKERNTLSQLEER